MRPAAVNGLRIMLSLAEPPPRLKGPTCAKRSNKFYLIFVSRVVSPRIPKFWLGNRQVNFLSTTASKQRQHRTLQTSVFWRRPGAESSTLLPIRANLASPLPSHTAYSTQIVDLGKSLSIKRARCCLLVVRGHNF